jgi:hypothetical protein
MLVALFCMPPIYMHYLDTQIEHSRCTSSMKFENTALTCNVICMSLQSSESFSLQLSLPADYHLPMSIKNQNELFRCYSVLSKPFIIISPFWIPSVPAGWLVFITCSSCWLHACCHVPFGEAGDSCRASPPGDSLLPAALDQLLWFVSFFFICVQFVVCCVNQIRRCLTRKISCYLE